MPCTIVCTSWRRKALRFLGRRGTFCL
ncbi:unnamed protein product [Linum tenue]|uniref:Uncharacterized protein n=1 Tax=Linum tenue TaxID=586396 RepID=A0AAV0KP12_9ROSI|nr:unnamed protein product [Linum tenue]